MTSVLIEAEPATVALLREKYPADWVPEDPLTVKVGDLQGQPIVLVILFVRIGTRKVGFYHASSRVVDWEVIERWIDQTYPSVARVSGSYSLEYFHKFMKKET